MRSVVAVLAIALAVVSPVTAYASCPDINGPYFCCGGSWYQWEWSTSCAGTSGSVSTTTLSCYNDPGHQFTGSGTVTYSYTVGASDPVNNTTLWQVSQFFDFNDPTNSQYNTLTSTVSVTHNGSTTSYPILSWDGADGDLSCSGQGYYFFTAVAGDTITVTVTATNFNSPGTTIKAGTPSLFN